VTNLFFLAADLMGEDHSCALHRDAFAIPHHIDRLGRNAIELRERALDGLAVDVTLIHFSVQWIRSWIMMVTMTTTSAHIPMRTRKAVVDGGAKPCSIG
jgi:hypothetical protein